MLIAASVAAGLFLLALATVAPFSSEAARTKIADVLATRLESEVQLDRLTLDVLELRLTPGEEAEPGRGAAGEVHGARVVARWTLSYPEDAEREEASGLTLIVFERRGGRWRIVEDASM